MEPYKIAMLVFVIILTVGSAIALAVMWVKACKEAKKYREETNERT